MTFRARFVANIIHFAALQGASQQGLLAIVNKSLDELNNEELLIEAPYYNRIIETAVEETQNPLIGLQLGEFLSLSAAGLILQIVQHSSTVEEALHYMVDFANLGCSAMPFQLTQQSEEWELSLHPHPAWLAQSEQAVRQTMDGTMVFTLREFHTLTRQKYYPKRVHFYYPRPSNFLEYERIFKCPVHFNCPTTALFLENKQVVAPIITSDYRMLQILVRYAEEKLNQMDEGHPFTTKVKKSIINLMQPNFPTLEQLAANLNLSVRTLQRRLKAEQVTYKSVLDELKQQFAFDYLGNERLSIKEIAYLLNYADTSSFIRSFKRWTGQSPEQYRMTTKPL